MLKRIRAVFSDMKREFIAGWHQEDPAVVEGEVLSVTYDEEEPTRGAH